MTCHGHAGMNPEAYEGQVRLSSILIDHWALLLPLWEEIQMLIQSISFEISTIQSRPTVIDRKNDCLPNFEPLAMAKNEMENGTVCEYFF